MYSVMFPVVTPSCSRILKGKTANYTRSHFTWMGPVKSIGYHQETDLEAVAAAATFSYRLIRLRRSYTAPPFIYSKRHRIDAGQDDDDPDVAGVEGAPLDARQRERRNDLFRYVFDIRCRKVTVWFWDREDIRNQTRSPNQPDVSISLVTPFGKYRRCSQSRIFLLF
jgi:hypothetical protein